MKDKKDSCHSKYTPKDRFFPVTHVSFSSGMKKCCVAEIWGLGETGKIPRFLQHYGYQEPRVGLGVRVIHIHTTTLQSKIITLLLPATPRKLNFIWEMSPSCPHCPTKTQLSHWWLWPQLLSDWHSRITVTVPHPPLYPCLTIEGKSVVSSGFTGHNWRAWVQCPSNPFHFSFFTLSVTSHSDICSGPRNSWIYDAISVLKSKYFSSQMSFCIKIFLLLYQFK